MARTRAEREEDERQAANDAAAAADEAAAEQHAQAAKVAEREAKRQRLRDNLNQAGFKRAKVAVRVDGPSLRRKTNCDTPKIVVGTNPPVVAEEIDDVDDYRVIVKEFLPCSDQACLYDENTTYGAELLKYLKNYQTLRSIPYEYLVQGKEYHKEITGKARLGAHDDSVKTGLAAYISVLVALGPDWEAKQNSANTIAQLIGVGTHDVVKNVCQPVLTFLATYFDPDDILKDNFKNLLKINLYTWHTDLKKKAKDHGTWSSEYLATRTNVGRYAKDTEICKGIPFCFLICLHQHFPGILSAAKKAKKFHVGVQEKDILTYDHTGEPDWDKV
jgi:hypothetical protein